MSRGKKIRKSDLRLESGISEISENIENYLLGGGKNPWEDSISSLPYDLNPEIKFQIVKLCEEENLEEISRRLHIPIDTLKEWIKELSEHGRTEIFKMHRVKLNNLPRSKKVEILGEVAREGLEKVLAKYGMQRKCITTWTNKIRSTGIKGFISKLGNNSGRNRVFSKEEKMRIIGEMEEHGNIAICTKYDLSDSTIERWKGRYKHFGNRGLESVDSSGKRVKMDYSQEIKYEVIQNTECKGIRDTTLNYGIANNCVKTWKRQLDKWGYEKFMKGDVYEIKRREKNKEKKGRESNLQGVDLLATCGLFGGNIHYLGGGSASEEKKEEIEVNIESYKPEEYKNIKNRNSLDIATPTNISSTQYSEGGDEYKYLDQIYGTISTLNNQGQQLTTINHPLQSPHPIDITSNSQISLNNQIQIPPIYSTQQPISERELPENKKDLKYEDQDPHFHYISYQQNVQSLLDDVRKILPPIIYKKYKSVIQILSQRYIKPSFDMANAKITID